MNDAVFAQGLCYYKLFCTFIIGAILGDAVETVFCYRKYKTWLCRSSFIYGHMSVVWGFAFVIATILYYCMGEMNLLLIYLLGIMCGGVYEYFCSVFTENVMRVRFWDYSKMPHNIRGRINLKYCLYWGIATALWIKVLFPVLETAIEKIPIWHGSIISNILVLLVLADAVLTLSVIKRYMERMSGKSSRNRVEEYIDYTYPDSRIEKRYPHMRICYQKENICEVGVVNERKEETEITIDSRSLL